MLDGLLSLLSATYRQMLNTERSGGKSGEGLLRLFPGQVIRGLVLETDNGRALVQLGDHRLWAHLKTPLTVGKAVWLVVEQLAPALHLRLLAEVDPSVDEWRSMLSALKLPDAPAMRAAVQYLAEHRLPFDAGLLNRLHQWQQGRFLNPQGLWTAIHLRMRGLPLEFPLFSAVYRALSVPQSQQAKLFFQSFHFSEAFSEAPSAFPDRLTDLSLFRLDHWREKIYQFLQQSAKSSFRHANPEGQSVHSSWLGHLILQWPVSHGDAWCFLSHPLPPWVPMKGWLQLAYQDEGSHAWPSTGHLQIQLDMPHLKQLNVQLFWRENVLSMTVSSQHPIPESERRGEEERLLERLSAMGFRVRGIHWQVTDRPQSGPPWLPGGVDVRC